MHNRKLWNRRGIPLLMSFALLLTACGSGTSATTMHLTRAEGQVNVSDDAGAEVTLLDNLGLYSGYEVGTRQESFAWINLDDVKLTKMDQESEIAIQKEGKKLEIEVRSGSLFFNVTEPLEEDESLDIRTSTMGVGIRGTCGWVTENTAALLEGRVIVTAGKQTVTVNAGEIAVIAADGTLEVRALSAEDIPAFVRDEAAGNTELMAAVAAVTGSGTPDGQGTGDDGAEGEQDPGDEGTDEEQDSGDETNIVFIPWDEAGLDDHVMDWRDDKLASAMASMTGIKDREIMLSDVWEMRSLEMYSSLTAANYIKDISALGELKNLNYLKVPSGSLSDISVLSELPNLISLQLCSENISDISVLSSLTNLKYLHLIEGNLSDISALSGLTNLTQLVLNYNNISDISVLSGLTNLTYLSLAGNHISDINVLSGLTNLTHLILPSNNISDISVLSGLTNLTYLNLSDNHISDLSALSGLTNLQTLFLYGNNISDYSPVEFVENLEK